MISIARSARVALASLAAAVLAVACSPSDPDGGGGDGGPDAGHRGPPATKFAQTATRWAVPGSGLADGFFAPAVDAGYDTDERFWLTVDLDGDGKPDLVQTASTSGAAAAVWTDGGGAYWKVYKNTGAGLAATPTRWSVPSSGTPNSFFDASNAATYDGVSRYWITLDVTGDGKPDLVQTASTSGASAAVWTDGGGAYWKVYKNTGSGFEATATRWAVPSSGAPNGFFDERNAFTYNDVTRYWLTIDLTGDGKPDLVQTADLASDVHVWTDGGGAYWKVYANNGSGFATTATRWAVPASGEADGFFDADWANTVYWSTVDLDGDGKPDLVQTANPASGAQVWSDGGGAYWKVYKNVGNGFAASATRWAVPSSGLDGGFFAIANASTGQGVGYWQVYDADADGKPDLVQSADTAGSDPQIWTDGGGAYWKVYKNGGDGFTPMARWAVPASGADGGFFDCENAFTVDTTARYWMTFDVDGDGSPDLVHTCDTAAAGSVHVWHDGGGDYWKVYLAQP